MVLQGRDVLELAQTVTSKTAVFCPFCTGSSREALCTGCALVVAPTRELAEQIYQMSVDLGQNTKVRNVTLVS